MNVLFNRLNRVLKSTFALLIVLTAIAGARPSPVKSEEHAGSPKNAHQAQTSVFKVSGSDSIKTASADSQKTDSTKPRLDSSRLGVTAADTLSKRDTALFLKRFSVQSAPPASDTHPGIFAPTIKKTVQNQPRITVQKTGMASKPRIDLRVIIFSLSIMIIGLFVVFAVKKRRRPLFLTTTRLSVMDKEVQKTCRYIEKNFADPGLSVDSICKDLVTGAAFLEALFEKELGLDVEKFIEHVRINRARILIEENHGVSIDFAAKETGFSSSEVFAARFKKSVGTSFSEYCALRASQGNVQ